MVKKIIIVSIIGMLTGIGTLAGCRDKNNDEIVAGSAKSPKEQLIALESSGAIPKLERGNTLLGTDANSNGIRDDIETIITSNYKSNPQRAAAMQMAKAMQKALTVNKANIAEVKVVDREISRSINCIYSKFDDATGSKAPAQVGAELEAITANTKQRLLAYLQFNKALDGTSSALPDGDTCE